MSRSVLRFVSFAAGLAAPALAAIVDVPTARACGGLFCNTQVTQTFPQTTVQGVSQVAERIVFSVGEDGAVTAIIEIQYQGEADRFAWILPVDGSPTVGVSSKTALDRLQAQTNPVYQLTTSTEGTCDPLFGGGGFGPVDAAVSFRGDGGPSAPPPVTVVDRGIAGPYDYVVISVMPTMADRVEVASSWLSENGYQATPDGIEALRPYLDAGQNLLAIRLTKGNDVGSIRPIRLTFGSGLPTIPIRPTASSASPDMGILVWVLGRARAVPANYRSIELNEAMINWFNPANTYGDAVTRAANEAGGQGFVTELAGDAAGYADSILQPFELATYESLRSVRWGAGDSERDLVLQSTQFFSQFDGYEDVLRAHLPVPPGTNEDAFYACPLCYADGLVGDIEGFEPAAFLRALEEEVVEPMRLTAELFRTQPYVTRLYTTMSAHEMTVDPSFDFNADLGTVSNIHSASRVIECAPGRTTATAPWRVVLPNGTTVRGMGTTWPFSTADDDVPAALRLARVGPTGEGEILLDNAGLIRRLIDVRNRAVPGSPSSAESDRSLCSAAGPGGARSLALGVFAGALAIAVRRRSGRRVGARA